MLVILTLFALLPGVAVDEVRPLSDSDVDDLISQLTPDPDRLWRKVPWQLSLVNGQAQAAEQKKPLFVWAMDGHPLGCT